MSDHICPIGTGNKHRRIRAAVLPAGALLLVFAGCNTEPKPTVAPTQFLQDTVKQYGALKSYSVAAAWSANADGVSLAEQRKFDYTAPNLYRVVSIHDNTLQETSISDGSQLSEYTNVPDAMPLIDNPPETLARAASPQMKSVLSASDPIYDFLIGDYGKLVKPGTTPSYGASVSKDGVDCQTVVLDSIAYGRMEAVIGIKDHLVRQIKFDGASLIKTLTPKDAPLFAKPLPDTLPKSAQIVENYSGQVLNPSLPDSTYETRIPITMPPFNPRGTASPDHVASSGAGDSGGGEEMPTPLPTGSMAPPMTVTDVRTGNKVSLASLRGHPIMIDFWATWCGPCVESMPATQEISSKYGPQGLEVMAISAEETPTITNFFKKTKYTFPVYNSADEASLAAYHTGVWPMIVLIDKDGKIAFVQQGYGGPEREKDALKLIGFGA